jgi:hypothetical protein
LLRFLQDPFLEVDKVKSMRVLNFFSLQPFDEKREMVRYLLPVEDSVYHVAAEQPHLYLVTRVRVDLPVLVN